MRKYLDKFAAFVRPAFEKLVELGGGRYYLLPWGNDGRGTKVYLWPFIGVALVLVAAVAVDLII